MYLHYPEQIVSDADDIKASYNYRLKDDESTIYLLANCVIPATREAASMVDELLREYIREYEKSNTTQGTMTASLQSSSDLFCDLPNSEGFTCMEGTCWHSIDMNICCGPDGCGLPEVEVVSEIEDCTDECGGSGGGGPVPPPPPNDPDAPWLPPPNGGGGGICTTCEPGDNPNDNDGDELCPLGQIADGNGGCIGEEDPDPCLEPNPPLYCQCQDTGNTILDNRALQIEFDDMWNKQLNSNKEQGGFLYENNLTGDWQFFELTDSWVDVRTITRLEFFVPSNLPNGSIYIHTHPTRSSLENYGITNEYIHGPSDDDRAAMVYMNDKYGVEFGVIIDPEYRILLGSDGDEITREDRCGY